MAMEPTTAVKEYEEWVTAQEQNKRLRNVDEITSITDLSFYPYSML